mgnify:CR=1 FL=1
MILYRVEGELLRHRFGGYATSKKQAKELIKKHGLEKVTVSKCEMGNTKGHYCFNLNRALNNGGLFDYSPLSHHKRGYKNDTL